MKLIWTSFLICITLNLNAERAMSFSADSTLLSQKVLTEQTNLALRQLGHQLLLLEGNDTVAVKPVQQINQQTFLLPLAQSFYYDTLPFLLHTALVDLGINQDLYYVTVKDCASDTLILGYDVRQFHKGRIPCIGRAQYVDCNHIYVTFPNRKSTTTLASNHNWWYLLLLPIFVGIGFYYAKQHNHKNPMPILSKNNPPTINPDNQLLTIGQSQLDVVNQLLHIQQQSISLTFRETKLLHYFIKHTGQLLKREQLLANVWEEEGVIVGRSLDVFVSRLRKILKADASLAIKTVHGVGYRLEEV